MKKQTIDGVQRNLIEKAMLACFEAGHGITHDELRALLDKPECIKCCDTGEIDSGGVHPWGESINIPCECDLVAQSQSEVERLRTELQELRDSMSFRTSLVGEVITERDSLRSKLKELISAVRSINFGPAHAIDIIDDEPCYPQRKEWIDWILGLCDSFNDNSKTEKTELEILRQEVLDLEECLRIKSQFYDQECATSRNYKNEVDAMREKLAERDALLRSTSIRLHNAHHKMDRLMEISPIHKVKLLTDAMHHVAYAHKCIDMPATTEPKSKPQN